MIKRGFQTHHILPFKHFPRVLLLLVQLFIFHVIFLGEIHLLIHFIFIFILLFHIVCGFNTHICIFVWILQITKLFSHVIFTHDLFIFIWFFKINNSFILLVFIIFKNMINLFSHFTWFTFSHFFFYKKFIYFHTIRMNLFLI